MSEIPEVPTDTSTPIPSAVWAFAAVDAEDECLEIYNSAKAGRSRFGWSIHDENNLRGENWSDWHSQQLFLLQIQPGDWIVHVNTPHRGKCLAVRVTGVYGFDEGIQCKDRIDFRHFIPVDPTTAIEFDRRDPNVLPTVNLRPRQRYHRIYAIEDFLKSLDNLKIGRVSLKFSETRELFHFRDKTKDLLSRITALLQSTHRSKDLECFFARVFRRLPGVVDVNENGFGWRTDHGADLIITTRSVVANITLEQRVVVQVKSFTNDHYSLDAVEQVITGMKQYDAVAGIIISTAQKTEQLEAARQAAANEIGKPIELIAGDDVARFVIQNAPDLVFELSASV